jgi:hypothetical protein
MARCAQGTVLFLSLALSREYRPRLTKASDRIEADIAVVNDWGPGNGNRTGHSGFDIHFAPETAILHSFASRFRDQLQTQA